MSLPTHLLGTVRSVSMLDFGKKMGATEVTKVNQGVGGRYQVEFWSVLNYSKVWNVIIGFTSSVRENVKVLEFHQYK